MATLWNSFQIPRAVLRSQHISGLRVSLDKSRHNFKSEREPMVKPPRIVKEHKRGFKTLPPPPRNRIVYPKAGSKKLFEIYITKTSMDKVEKHCKAYAQKMLEVMGFLIGDIYRWKNHEFVLVKDVISTDLEATNISVRFQREGFNGLFEKMDDLNYDYIIVGWYHSHPGLGCFLSSKDIETQRRIFNSPFHTALVVDPVKQETKAYKLKGKGYVERDFAVYGEKRC